MATPCLGGSSLAARALGNHHKQRIKQRIKGDAGQGSEATSNNRGAESTLSNAAAVRGLEPTVSDTSVTEVGTTQRSSSQEIELPDIE